MEERKFFRIREPEHKKFEVRRTLHDVSPIEEGSLQPQSREDLSRLVEEPLVDACKILFDKGIRTWMSSANKKDITSGEVYIIIYADNLTPHNMEVAMRHGKESNYRNNSYIKIAMPVSTNTTVQEISEYMTKIAAEFEAQ